MCGASFSFEIQPEEEIQFNLAKINPDHCCCNRCADFRSKKGILVEKINGLCDRLQYTKPENKEKIRANLIEITKRLTRLVSDHYRGPDRSLNSEFFNEWIDLMMVDPRSSARLVNDFMSHYRTNFAKV